MELALMAGHIDLFYRILLIMYMFLNRANAETGELGGIHNR